MEDYSCENHQTIVGGFSSKPRLMTLESIPILHESSIVVVYTLLTIRYYQIIIPHRFHYCLIGIPPRNKRQVNSPNFTAPHRVTRGASPCPRRRDQTYAAQRQIEKAALKHTLW